MPHIIVENQDHYLSWNCWSEWDCLYWDSFLHWTERRKIKNLVSKKRMGRRSKVWAFRGNSP